jgi:hypothetical protein
MMKKRSKWTKWQVGAVGVLGLAFLLQEVKVSPVFDQAVAAVHADTSGSNPAMGNSALQRQAASAEYDDTSGEAS